MAHYYTTEKTPDARAAGEPRHKQPLKRPAKDGRTTTDTTMRHARVQFLAPSVSAITDIYNKPGLNNWRVKQMRQACINTLSATGELNEKDVKVEFEHLTTAARDEGTRIHHLINRALDKGEYPILNTPDWTIVKRAIEESMSAYAGHKGRLILDYKTKDETEEDFEELLLWDDHYMQLAAYREMLRPFHVDGWASEVPYAHPLGYGGTCDFIADTTPTVINPNTKCFIMFVNTRVPGQIKLVEAEPEVLDVGWDKFLVLLQAWKLFNDYDASY